MGEVKQGFEGCVPFLAKCLIESGHSSLDPTVLFKGNGRGKKGGKMVGMTTTPEP